MSETIQLMIRQRNIAEQRMQVAEQRELAALRERDAALARVRQLEAGLKWAIAADGHLYPCPSSVGSTAPSKYCSESCRDARAAIAWES